MGWLVIIGGLFVFGYIVDWVYKRKGIRDFDPEENAKHVSDSERVYMESFMHNVRNDQHNSGGF
ncbi:hypothetical protein [Bacillus sp. JJ1764]|uniref:hypothetical protein n=1 Tax=Bacillus sp. JJ1764 TaxID=3122964 RepID=UPI002FFD7FA2